jgi:hypothetical protein
MAKARKRKSRIELKYSLLDDKFVSTIGKTRTQKLKDSIFNWKKKQNKQAADELIDIYVQSLVSYWKKTKLKNFKKHELDGDFDLVVDLIYKKGRKPNTIRLDNNSLLKEQLLRQLKT